LASVLEQACCSLLVSTYQAGQLLALGTSEGELTFSFRRFEHVMGVAVTTGRLAVAGNEQIWFLDDHTELAPVMEPEGTHDRCWLPRSSVVTGPILCHEIAWSETNGKPELWIVNTAFSCLAGLDAQHSFVPRWRPPFVTALAAQDRCHLNGLALRDGEPAFVTVMALTNEPRGWRAGRNDSGAALDVGSGEVVTRGMAMPHSPRWHDGNLYVLNSGLGRLERVDIQSGHRDVVAMVPGYARGLALHGDLAFVGLSRIRETAVFGGAPIAEYHERLTCGVGVIELSTGNTVATLQFLNGVEEIFDVQVVPGTRSPTLGGEEPIWLLPGGP
jgi:uncharacterized protein (TIGR03032 family)